MKIVRTRWTWSVVLLFVTQPAILPAQEQPAIDPDLAAAIQEDLAQKQETQPLAIVPLNQGKHVALNNMNPKISLILNSCLGWHSQPSHIHQGGHAPDANGFTLQGLEFAASASVDPYFRFHMNFELAHMHIEEVYLTTLALPANLQARVGFLMRPSDGKTRCTCTTGNSSIHRSHIPAF